jgi:hypothetical protein
MYQPVNRNQHMNEITQIIIPSAATPPKVDFTPSFPKKNPTIVINPDKKNVNRRILLPNHLMNNHKKQFVIKKVKLIVPRAREMIAAILLFVLFGKVSFILVFALFDLLVNVHILLKW